MPSTPVPALRAAPPVPQNLQQLALEQTSCFRTLCLSLERNLAALRDVRCPKDDLLSLADTRDFIELMVSLVVSDPNPYRLSVLLIDQQGQALRVLSDHVQLTAADVQPRGDMAFSVEGWHNIQVQALQTLAKLVGVCCDATGDSGADDDRNVSRPAFKLLRDSGGLDLILAQLAQRDENRPEDALRVAAAECLFVCVSRIPEARVAVVRTRTVSFICDVLWKEQSAMVRNYLCAMLRVVAEHSTEAVLDTHFVESALRTLTQATDGKYVMILLFEILTVVFQHFPSFYRSRVQASPALVTSLCSACSAVLRSGGLDDVVPAMAGLVECVVKVEGADRGRCSFLKELLGTGAWAAFADASGATAVACSRLRCLLRFAAQCTTPEMAVLLEETVCGQRAVVSALVACVADTGHCRGVREEAGAVLLLLAAKSVRVRRALACAALAGSHSLTTFRAHLCDVLQPQSESGNSAAKELLRHTHIVDSRAVYLNHPAPLAGVDWTDLADVSRAAQKLVADQGSPAGPAESWVPEETESVLSAADPRNGALSAADKRERLTAALLCHCIEQMAASADGPTPAPQLHTVTAAGLLRLQQEQDREQLLWRQRLQTQLLDSDQTHQRNDLMLSHRQQLISRRRTADAGSEHSGVGGSQLSTATAPAHQPPSPLPPLSRLAAYGLDDLQDVRPAAQCGAISERRGDRFLAAPDGPNQTSPGSLLPAPSPIRTADRHVSAASAASDSVVDEAQLRALTSLEAAPAAPLWQQPAAAWHQQLQHQQQHQQLREQQQQQQQQQPVYRMPSAPPQYLAPAAQPQAAVAQVSPQSWPQSWLQPGRDAAAPSPSAAKRPARVRRQAQAKQQPQQRRWR